MSWIEMNAFWQEAITLAVNDYVKQQNEQQSKQMQDMNSRIEGLKPHTSAMAGMPMPSFGQK